MNDGADRVVTPGESGEDDPWLTGDSRRALRSWLPRIAWAVGSVFLAVAALPFVTRGVWSSAPRDAEGLSDQPIPSLGTVAALALLVTLPYLLFPIAFAATTTVVDQQVEAATVRGNRSVRLDRIAHVGATVVTKTAKDVPDEIRQAVVTLAAAHPDAVSTRARAHLRLPDRPAFTRRTLLGSLTVLAWIAWTFMVLGGGAFYLWLLG